MSTSGDIMGTLGDIMSIMSISENTQYTGGGGGYRAQNKKYTWSNGMQINCVLNYTI